jgi:NAD+ synthase
MVSHMNLEPIFRDEFQTVIKQFISAKVTEAGADGVVIGVSGGVDSAVILKLSTIVLANDKISAVFLPESTTPALDAEHAKLIADDCQVKLLKIPIDDILKSYLKIQNLSKLNSLVLGNLKARIRMNVLFSLANSLNRLVLGTSNKSELLLGYFTKYGDGASDVAPIGDLYKTQVYRLAEHLKLPTKIIQKPPTAGLILNQTDEAELGLEYFMLDKILFGLERDISTEKLAAELNLSENKIFEIKHRVEQNRHKRKFPKIPKLGIKTIGLDLYE